MSHWKELTLGEISRPKQWPTLARTELVEVGFPVYGANGPIGFHDEFTHENPTILIGCRGSCGTVHITPSKAYANGNAMALDDLDEGRVDINFLANFFRWRGFKDVITGTSQPQIIGENLKRVKIPLPALTEQRRIATILDKADALRVKRQEALDQIDSLGKSIFVEMFGEPAKNPKGWPVRTLKELGKVSTGGTPPSAMEGMFGGDIPFVTPGDLESDLPVRRTVTDAGAREAGTVRAGAALVCCIGATIGKMGIASVRSSFNQQLNAVEWFGEQVDDRYGLAALRFFKPTIVTWGASTTLPILKKSSFEKVSIPVPPLSMQQEFAKRSLAVARLEERLRDAASVDSCLFAALQSRAFQGGL